MAKEIISGIYQIKNKINNKIYIGSSKDICKRWRYHIADFKANRHCNKYFQASWDKYGEDNFEFSILEKVTNLEDLKDIEQQYLLKLNPFKENGYNLCKTTESYTFGYKLSEDTKNKMKNKKFTEEHILNIKLNIKKKCILQFDLYGRLIKKWNSLNDIISFNPIYKMSSIYCCCNSNTPHISSYGYLWFYEEDFSDDRLQHCVKNQCFSNKKAIVQLSLQCDYIREWNNIAEASKAYNLSSSDDIAKCCKGIRKTSFGFKWVYLEDYNLHKDTISTFLNNLHKPKEKTYKKVVQLDMNYNVIKTWESVKFIVNSLNLKYDNIMGCCRGDIKSSGGYRWIYENEYKIGNYEKSNLNGQAKPVIQLSLDKQFLREWTSCNEIQNILNYPASSIKSTCNGRFKTHEYKGYLWFYKENYINQV